LQVKRNDQVLEVWGELACFTRPELKVERFSYPIITPSAARGIYDAIYCKPNKNPEDAEFRWQVTKIEVLSPPSYIALRRNEVKNVVPPESTILRWAEGKELPQPIEADQNPTDDKKGRTQRQTMALKNVRYRLHAEIRPWERFKERQPALEAQFRRRASSGKCFYQPYLGCREFPAYFELVEPGAPVEGITELNSDLGFMLYDVFDLSKAGTDESAPSISLFRAKIKKGVLEVPDYESPDVLKGWRKEEIC
jgi:CRISPR-associated protein Cas5d